MAIPLPPKAAHDSVVKDTDIRLSFKSLDTETVSVCDFEINVGQSLFDDGQDGDWLAIRIEKQIIWFMTKQSAKHLHSWLGRRLNR